MRVRLLRTLPLKDLMLNRRPYRVTERGFLGGSNIILGIHCSVKFIFDRKMQLVANLAGRSSSSSLIN